jgi:PIN domain nuclease of toxin-antitoxin system
MESNHCGSKNERPRAGDLPYPITNPAPWSHHPPLAKVLPIHKDPIDRLLVAQPHAEGIHLLTHDAIVAQYQGVVRLA